MPVAPSLTCPLRGAECAASAKVHFSLTVLFRFACLATWWRGLFEQCVVDFCSVPRGGVKKKNRSRTDRAVCRGLLLCTTRWRKKKIGRGPIEQRVGDFCSVPRGGVGKKRENGKSVEDELWVEDFCSVPRGGVEKNKGKHEISGRGPIGRCVEKFCPVPRGGVKRKTKKIGRAPLVH